LEFTLYTDVGPSSSTMAVIKSGSFVVVHSSSLLLSLIIAVVLEGVEANEVCPIDNEKCTTDTRVDGYCVATKSWFHEESPGCLPGYEVEELGTREVVGFGGTGYNCRQECGPLIIFGVLGVVSLCTCGGVLTCYVKKTCCFKQTTRVMPMTLPTDVPIQVCGSPIAAPAPIVAVTPEGSSLLDFLKSLGLERFESTFTGQEVSMSDLKLMSEKDLEALGLPMGPRMRILGALKK